MRQGVNELEPYVFKMSRVEEQDLALRGLEDFVDRNPVDAGRLHRHAHHAARCEPVCVAQEIAGEGPEQLHRCRITFADVVRRYSSFVESRSSIVTWISPRQSGQCGRIARVPGPSESTRSSHVLGQNASAQYGTDDLTDLTKGARVCAIPRVVIRRAVIPPRHAPFLTAWAAADTLFFAHLCEAWEFRRNPRTSACAGINPP